MVCTVAGSWCLMGQTFTLRRGKVLEMDGGGGCRRREAPHALKRGCIARSAVSTLTMCPH